MSDDNTALPATSPESDSVKKVLEENENGKNENVILKLIVSSGKFSEFILPQAASVGEVTEHVYKNWPEEWMDEKDSISSHHILRLIYQGRFLHENVTFKALNIAPGKRVVMHLVPREQLPQISPEDMEPVSKSSERSCCCIVL